jgi:hypothetical protein
MMPSMARTNTSCAETALSLVSAAILPLALSV